MTYNENLPAIIADDFSGAMDSGVQFARVGYPTRLMLQGLVDWPVVVVSTNSRELPPEQAAERCRLAVQPLTRRKIFKKIDSTLRGQVSIEIDALLDVTACARALVCPAAPLQGRVVRNGRVYIHEVPIDQSSLRLDPTFPAQTAVISEILARPVTHLPLEIVRGPLDNLASAVHTALERYVVPDAETVDDLARIYRACREQDVLLCGAFGLASAWAEVEIGASKEACVRHPIPSHPPDITWENRVLVVSGSAHPTTRAQVQRLAHHANVRAWPIDAAMELEDQNKCLHEIYQATRTHPVQVIFPGASETIHDIHWQQFSQLAGRLGARLVEAMQPDLLFIIGGETASHLFNQLETQAVDLLGEAAPGIPVGQIVGGFANGLKIITKSGGFGSARSLESIIFD